MPGGGRPGKRQGCCTRGRGDESMGSACSLILGEGGFWAVCSHDLHSIGLRAAPRQVPFTREPGVQEAGLEAEAVDSGDGRLR